MPAESDARSLLNRLAELERENAAQRERIDSLEAASRQGEHLNGRYRSIFENSIVGVIQTSLEGKLLLANPAAVKMFGAGSLGEMLDLSQDISESLYARKDQRQEVIAALISQGRLDNFEFEVKTKSGSIHTILVNAVLVKDAAGRPSYVESSFLDVTEKHRALEAMKDSENKYRSLFENSVFGILQTSLDGKVLLANPALARMYGVDDPNQLDKVQNVWDELCRFPEDGYRLAEQLFQSGRADNYLIEAKRVDGRSVWVEGNSILVRDAEGHPLYIESTFMDATKRQTALEALQESERKYRTLFDRAFEGIFQTTLEGRYLSVNAAMAGIFGYSSPEEMLSADVDITTQQLADPHYRELMLQLLNEQGFYENLEGEAVRSDGKHIWLLGSARMIYGDDGAPQAIEGSCIDITARKLAELRLTESEEKYSKVFQSSPFAITITSLETGLILEANQAMVDLVGYSLEELVGHTSAELGLYHQPELREQIFARLFAQGQIQGLETQVVRQDGRILTVILSLSVVEIAGQKCFLNIADDVTERNAIKEQLAAVQKLDAIGQLAGGVAHDFNNLLTVILGYGEDLAANLPADSPQQQTLSEILKAGKRASRLTQQLLTFGSKQVVTPRVADLNGLVQNLCNMLVRLLGGKIEFDLLLAEHPCPVKADIGQVEQIIVNLVINSRDAMPAGGKLTVRTGRVQVGEGSRAYPAYVDKGEYILLEVADTGCGMDKDALSKVFEPFFTTKKNGRGLGLGMPTVYGAVKQSNGFILVDSEPERGTQVRVLLPESREAPGSEPPVGSPEQERGQGEFILVVEDEEALCKMIKQTLEFIGYQVVAEVSSTAALASLEAGLRPDLIICDVDMPKLNGRELAERVWRLHPEQKVLFMSGYTEDEVLRREIRDQNVSYIAKPFNLKDMAAQINRLVRPAGNTGTEL